MNFQWNIKRFRIQNIRWLPICECWFKDWLADSTGLWLPNNCERWLFTELPVNWLPVSESLITDWPDFKFELTISEGWSFDWFWIRKYLRLKDLSYFLTKECYMQYNVANRTPRLEMITPLIFWNFKICRLFSLWFKNHNEKISKFALLFILEKCIKIFYGSLRYIKTF